MVSIATAESWIDNDTIFIGSRTWYRFNENYNITGKLLYIDDNYFNINTTYIFNITPSSEKCNSTLITLNSSRVEWNLACGTGVDSVYHTIGNFSGRRNLLINYTYNVTLNPSDGQVVFNYTGGFSTMSFELILDNASPDVSLISPSNNTILRETAGYYPVLLTYNFSESIASGFVNCTLFIGDIKNETMTYLDENTNYNFSTNLTYGWYSWNVECRDPSLNSINSTKWFFRIKHTGGGVGGVVSGITPTTTLIEEEILPIIGEPTPPREPLIYDKSFWVFSSVVILSSIIIFTIHTNRKIIKNKIVYIFSYRKK